LIFNKTSEALVQHIKNVCTSQPGMQLAWFQSSLIISCENTIIAYQS